MTQLVLPGPEGPYATPLNLALVEALEQDANLLHVAEKLTAREMKLGDIVVLLMRIYRHAGCTLTGEDLSAFLLTQAPATLLADVLLTVLTPLAKAGAIDREKKS